MSAMLRSQKLLVVSRQAGTCLRWVVKLLVPPGVGVVCDSSRAIYYE